MPDDIDDEPKPVARRIIGTPRNIRPRSSANAEINAQEADKVRRDMGVGYPLAPNQSYAQGGKIGVPKGPPKASILPKHASNPYAFCTGGKVIKSHKF